MLSPRWIKLTRDLKKAPGRVFIMLAAMAAGIFGFATLLTSYTLLTREVSRNYAATHPASARVQADSINASLLAAVRQFPAVAFAQAGASVHGSIYDAAGELHPLTVFVIDDFQQLNINTFFAEAGAWPPLPNTLLLERNSLKVLKARLNDPLRLQLQGGDWVTTRASGSAHDPALAFSNYYVYAYASLNTVQALGVKTSFTDINIRTHEPLNARAIEQTASAVALWLQQQGHKVGAIRIPPPGEHPHQAIMFGVISAFLVFSVVAFVLCAVLMATLIDGLMAPQLRQIGVMKTLGACHWQIAIMYLSFVGVLGVLATLVAVPCGVLFGQSLSRGMLVNWLNFNVQSLHIPQSVYILLVAAGVLVPMLAALVPIAWAIGVPVQTTLSYAGTGRGRDALNQWGAWLVRLLRANRVIAMALRNCLRRPGRLLQVVSLLAFAGAVFISALNVRHAVEKQLSAAAAQRHYDLEIHLASPASGQAVLTILMKVAGIEQAQTWSQTPVARHRADGLTIETTYPDDSHGLLSIAAIAPDSTFLTPAIKSGRGLNQLGIDEVVLNGKALHAFEQPIIDERITLSVGGRVAALQVVGIADEKMSPGIAYVSAATYEKLTNQQDLYTNFRIRMTDHRAENVAIKAREIESVLAQQHFYVTGSISEQKLRYEVDGHLSMLINALLQVALLIALVGLIGMGSALCGQITERSGEFGVMRILGAGSKTLMQIILAEGMFIGFISWLAALIVSVPLALGIGYFLGNLIFDQAFEFVFSPHAIGSWFVILISGALVACMYPAWKAVRMNIRSSFAY
ncbi:MAG TPA: FtsX-like permease family protein [Cellvibrionaceae bacterium]